MKKTILAAVLASSAVFASTSSAFAACGLDCWLSNTFSSRDFVGDWIKDTFGPVHNDPDGKAQLMENLKQADKIVGSWPVGKSDGKGAINFGKFEWTMKGEKPTCDLEKLTAVVIKNKSPETLLKTCFK